jgi:hypothetical protein
MRAEGATDWQDPRVQTALAELERLSLAHYPEATFQVERGEDDPEAIHLLAIVDAEDTIATLAIGSAPHLRGCSVRPRRRGYKTAP